MNTNQPINLIVEKMLAERPTLRAYLKTMQQVTGKSDRDWSAIEGGEANAFFQRGRWNAYRDIERLLEDDGFAPEPGK